MTTGTNGPTRRDVLHTAATAGVVAGIAGCTSDDDNGDSGEGISIEWQNLAQNSHPPEYEAGRLTADAFRNLGIQVDFQGVETSTILERLGEQEYDIMFMGFGPNAARLDPDTFLSWFTEGHPSNYWDWSNDEFEEKLEEQRQEFDTDARQELVYETQEIWAEHQPATLLYRGNRIHLIRDKFPDPITFPGNNLNNFWNRVYVEPDDDAEDAVMRIAVSDPFDDTNPVSAVGGQSQMWMRQIYDRLYRTTAEGVPEPWVATGVEREDETTLHVTIRDELTWHDGEDLTAEDVKFSFEYQAEHDGFFKENANTFEEITVESDTELTFHLEEPDSTVLSLSFGQVFLIPQHIWSEVDDPLNYPNEEVIGSGPFRFESRQPGQETQVVRFEDYFEPASIEREIYTPFEDRSGAVRAVENDEADMYIGLSPAIDTIERVEDTEGVNVISAEDFGIFLLLFSTEEEPYSDVAFRRALAHAAPKADIVDIVLDGRGIELNSPITQANEFWHNPDVPQYGNDVEAGRQVLEEAGYSWNDDGNLLPPE